MRGEPKIVSASLVAGGSSYPDGSAGTVGRCNGLTTRSLSLAEWPSPTVQPSNPYAVRNSCIRCKLDASVTIRPPLPSPVQQVSPIRAETDLLQLSGSCAVLRPGRTEWWTTPC
jgi:hypothetical protein